MPTPVAGPAPAAGLTAEERRAIDVFTQAGFEVQVLSEPVPGEPGGQRTVPAPLRLVPGNRGTRTRTGGRRRSVA